MNTESWALNSPLNWIPILMFHEVVPNGTAIVPPYAVTEARLREILRDFSDRGYTSGTLEDVTRKVNGNGVKGSSHDTRQTRRKRVVLTFDDGTRDFIEIALPVLQEFGFSATVFVVAGMVGGVRAWNSLPGQPLLTPAPLMNADELRALHDSGFTIGSHTVSHPALPTLSVNDARQEVAGSRQILMSMLGRPVHWFAYPYLAANHTTCGLVSEAGYQGACGGPNQKHARFYLNRIDASYFTVKALRLRCDGWFHGVRQAIRQARYGSGG